jgi:chemotaxis protein MotB
VESGNESAPIIKKIKKHHSGGHGGAWKVAYADFVTAMMALFIVLWVLSSSEKVKESVASYFKDPIGFSSKSKILIEGKASPPIDLKLQNEMQQKEAEKLELEKIAEKVEHEISADTELMGLAGQVKIEVTKEGLRIELTDSANDIFFEIGTSNLKDKAVKLLEKIGKEIGKLPNKIIVEGHTDSRQFNNIGTGFTNFELSSERALAAKRALVRGGLEEKHIDEIHGYADTRLRDKNNPLSFVNRRISITVKYLSQNQ